MPPFFLKIPVIGILRGVSADFFKDLMPACFEAGLDAIEVTCNTEGAARIIAANRPLVPEGKFLGMGTVRDLNEAEAAVQAGAMFLVTPNLDSSVIEYGSRHGVPTVAGALTPTEVYRAWSDGAAMIKVFPCGIMGGPRYIKELRGPFDRISLMAVGGVGLEDLGAYFAAGVNAVGVSSALFGKEALKEKDLKQLTKNVKTYISQCAAAIRRDAGR